MIIHQPEIITNEREVVLSARVEYARLIEDIPDRIWLCYPIEYKKYISDRADALAVGMLMTAMNLGEDIEVCGTVSPQLLYGIQEVQRVFHAWLPKLFTPVEIKCDQLAPMPALTQQGVGLMFSGGIDSLYTLWAHQPENQALEEYRITHCVFLNGFDISLLYPEDFNAAQRQFARMAESLKIDLVTCRSNLHSFIEGRSPWIISHISALIAPVFGLSKLFNKLLLASPLHYNDLMPTGVTPVTDHLFSTESLQVIHHGADKVKPYKLEAIADWKPAQQYMRICVDQDKRLGVQNCGECFKCLRTRVNLKMVGAKGFETIPGGASLGVMLRWALRIHAYGPWAQEMTRYALDKKKWGYLSLYWFATLVSWIKRMLRKLMPRRLFLWLRKRLFPPHKNPFLHSTISAQGKGSFDDHIAS